MKISIGLAVIGALVLMIFPAVAVSITVDGNPSDWGPTGFLTGDWSKNDTWLPYSGIQFIVEDNRNPKAGNPNAFEYPSEGVHIRGSGSSYVFYDEPQVLYKGTTPVWEPYGGENYDLEGVYFYQDNNYVYLLIVTSVPPDGKGDEAPGDLRIDINKSLNSPDGYKYEMGVKLGNNTGLKQGHLYLVSDWAETPSYIPANLPNRIVSGTDLGAVAAFNYTTFPQGNLGTGQDAGEPIYVVEMKIAKTQLGLTPGTYVRFSDFSAVDNCTNDAISVPEFVSLLIPLGIIVGFVYFHKRK
ncbi:MAG: hypothetical protein H0Z28_09680 [Archaeoglobus sp.]|nr:hypothetical protein [Archaeoglobus sp.]